MTAHRGQPELPALAPIAKLLGYTPHKGQLLVHNSNARIRVAVWGRRAGKSLCATVEAIRAALAPGKSRTIFIVAPTYGLSERIFAEIRSMIEEHFRDRIIRAVWSKLRVEIRNLGGGITLIEGKSADKPLGLVGAGVDLAIVDEAAMVDSEVWQKYLSPTLVDRKGRALLISTPRGRGWLHAMWLTGQPGPDKDPDVESWQLPTTANPTIDPAEIEKARNSLPASVFNEEYLAEFLSGSSTVFRNVRECATLVWPSESGIPPIVGDSYNSPERYTAGLDLAQVADFTVLTVLDSQRRVVFIDRFNKLNWDIAIPRICASLSHYNNASCLVDASGMGLPLFERLRDSGANVKPFKFTADSKKDVIQNLQAQLEHGQIELPESRFAKILIEELEAYQYSKTEGGVVRMSAPSGQHDDCVISLALGAFLNRVTSTARAQIRRLDISPGPSAISQDSGIHTASTGGRRQMNFNDRLRRIYR